MGHVILETGAIPRVDIFSFTAAGKIFIVQNWLAEIIFYFLYNAGGYPVLIFANALLLAFVLIPVLHLCLKVAGPLWASVLPTCLVALCLPSNMRPQVFSYGMFAVFYLVISCYCSGRKSLIWFLPFLMALWVNLHGAFVLGLGLIAIVLTCESLSSLFRPSSLIHRQAKITKLAFVFVLCVLLLLQTRKNSV
jgi:hypothetical protein